MMVKELDFIDLFRGEEAHQLGGKLGRFLVSQFLGRADETLVVVIARPFQVVRDLFPDGEEADGDLFLFIFLDQFRQFLPDVGIVGATQAAVGRASHDGHRPRFPLGHERGIDVVARRQQTVEDAFQFLGVAKGMFRLGLRMVQLGGRDHFHRRRDFLRAPNGRDASFYFFE